MNRLCLPILLLITAAPVFGEVTLEPRDEATLKSVLESGATWFQPGELEAGQQVEMKVLDRGVYRTCTFKTLLRDGAEFLIEVHNGRGLVFAFRLDGGFKTVRATWVGVAGQAPQECRAGFGAPAVHDYLDLPTDILAIASARIEYPDITFRAGDARITANEMRGVKAGVNYRIVRTEDPWFLRTLLMQAEGLDLIRCVSRKIVEKPVSLLDWSGTKYKDVPLSETLPDWTAPETRWYIEKREDGSQFVIPWGFTASLRPLPSERKSLSGSIQGPYPFVEWADQPLEVRNGFSFSRLTDLRDALETFHSIPRDSTIVNIVAIELGNDWSRQDVINTLPQLEGLTSVHISGVRAAGTGTPDELDLAPLSKLKLLRSLTLSIDISPATLEAVGKLHNLTQLDWMPHKNENIPALEKLGALTLLEHLAIRTPSAKGLGKLTALRSLQLSGVRIYTDDKPEFTALAALTTLDLRDATMDASSLGGLKTLASLTCVRCEVVSLGTALAQMPQLETLSLSATTVGIRHADTGVLQDAGWKDGTTTPLSTSVTYKSQLPPEAWKCLFKQGVDRQLNLSDIRTEDWIDALMAVPDVCPFRLEQCWVNDEQWKRLAAHKGLRSLQVINTSGRRTNDPENDVDPLILSKFEFVETLSLRVSHDSSQLGALDEVDWSGLKALNSLRLASFTVAGDVTCKPEVIRAISAAPQLTELTLSGYHLELETIFELAKLTGLKRLTISGAELTAETKNFLWSSLKECELVFE